jgi:hypothetical protein
MKLEVSVTKKVQVVLDDDTYRLLKALHSREPATRASL